MRTAPASIVLACAAALGVACADLKSASPDGDAGAASASSSSGASSSSSTSSSSSSGGSSSSSSGGSSGTTSSSSGASSGGPTGPGPYGALPTGYACTRNEDCRFRHCDTTLAICLDECSGGDASCQRPDLPQTVHCEAPDQFTPGVCQLPAGFVPLDPSKFARGTKGLGACCTATGDGTAGLECEGGRCLSWSTTGADNPFVCSNACATGNDCGSGYTCNPEIKTCVPGNDPYTCK